MNVYYNDNERFVCEWLRNLQAAGHLPAGLVDERSIVDVQAKDLKDFGQAHFFAGIGGWPLALKLAVWPDDRPAWTGSCPCQPFSVAGKAGGVGDERHLWPAFHRLIAECRPPVVFGEQVESKDGRKWLAGVRVDLEKLGYAVGTADLCAASVAAPHKRQRLYWVADTKSDGRLERRSESGGRSPESRCGSLGMANTKDTNGRRSGRTDDPGGRFEEARGSDCRPCGMADADGRDAGDGGVQRGGEHGQQQEDGGTRRMGEPDSAGRLSRRPSAAGAGHRSSIDAASPWADSRIILCRDGKSRRIPLEPALFPLAPRLPGRVGLLRGAGGSIVPQVAAAFVRAYMEVRGIVKV